jgi:Domain of unknown function (DUF1992)
LSEEILDSKVRRTAMGVEGRIRELLDAGELSGLPGEGQALPRDPDDEAGDAWAGRHVVRASGARPLWADLRRDIAEHRLRIVMRLRAHLLWLERRRALLQHLPAERIVPEVALTKEADARVRAEMALAIANLNAQVARHNLIVTATSLHVATATLDGLLDVARAPTDRESG